MAALNEGLHLYYFVGRLNPPHGGHIATLRHMLEEARKRGGRAIIILGSGPYGGLKTMDDPIPFELKREFLERELSEFAGLFEIVKRDNDVEQITEWSKKIISELGQPQHISFIQYAGNKDDNSTKLSYINSILMTKGAVFGARITTDIVSQKAVASNRGTDMSATTVRKDAYRSKLAEDPGSFFEKYKPLYKQLIETMYAAIIDGTRDGATEASDSDIQQYIDNGTLPEIQRTIIAKMEADKRKAKKEAANSKKAATEPYSGASEPGRGKGSGKGRGNTSGKGSGKGKGRSGKGTRGGKRKTKRSRK